ncbi:hypothetical protein E0W80_05500 [Microbacterium sp. PI-1]|uniref:hypothetical protein n=1 Tax=Microbacterium sp. PI-1 TaxID=2545631 RepID=UPI00103D5AE1|nr:hypothetical protein [Microbacterium sp. PI-1]TCJ28421.1 hypothetical protein E0W80_05500 [Microbacterium sp. PI-1]
MDPIGSEVCGDGVGAGIQPVADEGVAKGDDPVTHAVRDSGRGQTGATRAFFERGIALAEPAMVQFVDQRFRDPVSRRDCSVGQPLNDDGLDQNLVLRHPFTMS